jgi:hypothetical protein
VALFGAPVAHEDHARRAVVAACELRQRLRTPDALRGQPQGVALRLGCTPGRWSLVPWESHSGSTRRAVTRSPGPRSSSSRPRLTPSYAAQPHTSWCRPRCGVQRGRPAPATPRPPRWRGMWCTASCGGGRASRGAVGDP